MKSKALVKNLFNKPVIKLQIPRHNIIYGYGACSDSGCNCKAYEGNGDTCANCGHNYGRHW